MVCRNCKKTPPRHLDSVAKAEYRRIVDTLGKLPLRNLDRTELELYCTWYSVYKNTLIKLKEETDPDEISSFVSTLDKATRNIKGLASDLGLNVNSRMQMNMPEKEDDKPKSLKERYGMTS